MIKHYVIYHAICWDGLAAAWVAREHLRGFPCCFIPASHGDPLPDMDDGSKVYILDFSYNKDVIRGLAHRMMDVIIIDHHKTAIEELDGEVFPLNVSLTLVDGKSGCRLAWERFFPKRNLPLALAYIEDRDLWKWALTESREVNAAIKSMPMTFDSINHLATYDMYPGILPAKGRILLDYQDTIIRTHCDQAWEIELAGHMVLCVNATTLQSEIAGKLAEGRPFGACFEDYEDLRKWSLRSDKNGVDVSEIARKFGGGGHKHAAGFVDRSAAIAPSLSGGRDAQ